MSEGCTAVTHHYLRNVIGEQGDTGKRTSGFWIGQLRVRVMMQVIRKVVCQIIFVGEGVSVDAVNLCVDFFRWSDGVLFDEVRLGSSMSVREPIFLQNYSRNSFRFFSSFHHEHFRNDTLHFISIATNTNNTNTTSRSKFCINM